MSLNSNRIALSKSILQSNGYVAARISNINNCLAAVAAKKSALKKLLNFVKYVNSNKIFFETIRYFPCRK
jgi:hypothetical protein